ncbi:MAG: acyl-CoA dehydrogenase [Alphaproteobacteria bacterium]
MEALLFVLICLGAVIALALWRVPLWSWAVFVGAATLVIQTGYAFGPMGGISFTKLLGWLPTIVLGVLAHRPFRRQIITTPVYNFMKKIMPPVSATEREALEAGTVGFDAELFSGEPNWNRLRTLRGMELTEDERNFLDGPTEELCRMADDWQIRARGRDIPQEIWDFVKAKGFLGMLISKEYGGLGFSAQAQSLIIGKIASRSPDVAVIVMVPNSLGPGELIEKFGTDEQQERYLPGLARGDEIPCFALTGPYAGSDAVSMRDIGVVCKGHHNGEEVIGIRLSWDKRYITLSTNATILGLAFQLFDPENLLGKGEKLGITVALIPTNHPGVRIGDRRHLPCGNAFPNGPTWGEDVFIPAEWIVGGPDRAGQGWRMLMSCLAAGRAISLPASATAAAKTMLRTSTAYARIRSQFHIPIGRMEGIEAPLARIIEAAYLLESARAVTAAMVTAGDKPAVISAIMKYKCTEWGRLAVNDAMDIHGGKGICDGPSNYLQAAYQAIPVSITVEGANILTRSLMVIAQGALRSHPWLYKEVQALQSENHEEGFQAFEEAFEGHVGFSLANMAGAFFHNVTFGLFGHAPSTRHTGFLYKQLWRASRNFALVTDVTVALLGGGLKTKQHITGRLADALAEMYMLSCMLKRFEDDGEQPRDLAVLNYCAKNALSRFYAALDAVLHNFPNSLVGFGLRILVFPFGNRARPAKDAAAKTIVRTMLEPGAIRDALTRDIYINHNEQDATGVLEAALAKVMETNEAAAKLERAVREDKIRRFLGLDFIGEAVSAGIISEEEATGLREREALVSKVVAVDHFDVAEVTGIGACVNDSPIGHNSRAVEAPASQPVAALAVAPSPVSAVQEAETPKAQPQSDTPAEPPQTEAPADKITAANPEGNTNNPGTQQANEENGDDENVA